MDVKPWDDETDMGALEAEVRKIETDGLLWGAAKLVPVGYGIKKLQICCVVEDDKVGTDFLEEEICALEDYVSIVQSKHRFDKMMLIFFTSGPIRRRCRFQQNLICSHLHYYGYLLLPLFFICFHSTSRLFTRL